MLVFPQALNQSRSLHLTSIHLAYLSWLVDLTCQLQGPCDRSLLRRSIWSGQGGAAPILQTIKGHSVKALELVRGWLQ